MYFDYNDMKVEARRQPLKPCPDCWLLSWKWTRSRWCGLIPAPPAVSK